MPVNNQHLGTVGIWPGENLMVKEKITMKLLIANNLSLQ